MQLREKVNGPSSQDNQQGVEGLGKTAPDYGNSKQQHSLAIKQKCLFDNEAVGTGGESTCSAPFSKEYESDSLIMDRGIHCRVCHSSNHMAPKYRHLKQDTHLVRARNRNYESRFGMEGEHGRQTPYPAGRYLLPSRRRRSPSRNINSNNNNKWHDTQCTPRHGPRSSSSCWNAPD